MPPDAGGYLTLAEARQRYRISSHRLRRLIKRHGLKRYRKVLGADRRQYLKVGELDATGVRPT
jgi:hypothetical protein